MTYVAPTDVTDPPKGWSWATISISCAGKYRYSLIVSQFTPIGDRLELVSSDSRDDAFKQAEALRKAWNDEAKSA